MQGYRFELFFSKFFLFFLNPTFLTIHDITPIHWLFEEAVTVCSLIIKRIFFTWKFTCIHIYLRYVAKKKYKRSTKCMWDIQVHRLYRSTKHFVFSYYIDFFKIRLLYINFQDSLQQQKAFSTQHHGTQMKCWALGWIQKLFHGTPHLKFLQSSTIPMYSPLLATINAVK